MKRRVAQIDHVEMFVPDREAAAQWYGETLGLVAVPKAQGWAKDPGGPLMISSDDGATMVALFVGPALGEESPKGLRRLAFRCAGESFVAFAADRGCEPYDHGWSWSIYFPDPWGNKLEITTYDYDVVRDLLP